MTYHVLIPRAVPTDDLAYGIACAPTIDWRKSHALSLCVPSLTGYRLPFLDRPVKTEEVCRECVEAMKP